MVFTGLVQRLGLARFDPANSKLYLKVENEGSYWNQSRQGDSVAVNGVCLTLLDTPKPSPAAVTVVEFFVMEETLLKTNLSDLITASPDAFVPVNVEHAIRSGDSLGGS